MSNNYHISGSGACSEGIYNEIHISGSGRMKGNVECNELRISGSCHGEGVLTVHGEGHISGSLRMDGNVDAKRLRVSGSARVSGNVAIEDELRISGSVNADTITGKNISVSGGCHVTKDVEGEEVSFSGSINIEGLLNAEHIIIFTSDVNMKSKIGQIGGGVVEIKEGYNHFNSLMGMILRNSMRSRGVVEVDTIEADTMDLDHVIAKSVSGRDITIHEDVQIERLEYSGSLNVSPEAKIKEVIKVG